MPVKGPTMFIQKTLDATENEIIEFAEQWGEAVFEAQILKVIENLRA